jgi:hypothetical protein
LGRAGRRAVLCAVPGVLSLAVGGGSVWAGAYNYTGPDGGLWSLAANWTLTTNSSIHVVPINGDDAVLGVPTGVSVVNFSSTYTSPGLNNLTLDSVGHASITLNHNSGTMYASSQVIGNSANTSNYVQANGTTNTVSGQLGLAFGGTAVGTYSLANGALTANNEYIGYGGSGSGSFTQTAGINTAIASMQVGYFTTGAGTSTYNLQGGTLQFTNSLANLIVGYSGRAAFNQSGGQVNLGGLGGSLIVNQNNSPLASYTLSNTGAISNVGTISIGSTGAGTFTQTGGSVATTPTGTLNVGAGGSGVGYYTINTNTAASSINTALLNVGNLGIGTFTQNGGTVTTTSGINLATQTGSSGVYNLNAGTVSVPTLTVGNQGVGTMNVAGGNLTAGSVSVAQISNSTGYFNMTGGTVSASSALNIASNSGATGTIQQDAGSLNVNNGGTVTIAPVINSLGTYNITTASGPATASFGDLVSGGAGSGTFNIFAGTVNAGRSVTVARDANGIGGFSISGGSILIGTGSATGTFIVGGQGSGTALHQGGSVTLSSNAASKVIIGQSNGSSGSYQMQSGSLSAPTLIVADAGTGTFIQNGGTVTTSSLLLSNNGGGASFSVSAGATGLQVNGDEYVGYRGPAVFNNFGVHTVTGGVYIGAAAGASSTFNMKNGTLTTNSLVVSQSGPATFAQTGGTVNVLGPAYLGNGLPSVAASFSVSGGTFNTTNFYVGLTGAAIANQNGGTLNTSLLALNYNNGSSGTYNLYSGVLNVFSNAYIGLGAANDTAVFNQYSGTVNFPNIPNLSNVATVETQGVFNQYSGSENGYLSNYGTVNLNGGFFNGTLDNSSLGTVNVNANMLIGQGIVNHGYINVTGSVGSGASGSFYNDGTISLSGIGYIYSPGPITNNGTIYAINTFSGSAGFINNVTFQQGSGSLTFYVTGGASNFGTFQLATGRTFSLQSPLTNYGSFNISGALINGGALLSNGPGGVISGPGAIFTSFTNGGNLVQQAGTLNLGIAWSNSGIVQLQCLTANLAGAALTNTGLVQGFGSISNSINNTTGTIESAGGTLVVGGILSNNTGGTLVVDPGSKLFVSLGLVTNAGLISLSGGSFDNNGQPLNNTGSITGYGTFRTGGAGLTNNGAVTLTGGLTTVNGPVTNSAAKNFRIQYNPAIFTGAFTNNGNVFVTSTTATFAGGYLGGAAMGLSGDVGVIAATSTTPSLGGSGNITVSPGANAIVDGIQQNAVTIQGSAASIGKVTVASRQPGGFNVATGRTQPQSLSILNSLTIAQDGSGYHGFFDLADNDLLLRGQSLSSVLSMVQAWSASKNTGTPVGLGTTAGTAYTTLAVFPNSTYAPGVAYYPTMAGLSLTSSDIIVKYTYYGDINVDGVVDGRDYKAMMEAYVFGTGTGWTAGDFNYDGVVNSADMNLLLANLNVGRPGLGAPSDLPAITQTNVIPEPGIAGAMIAAAPLVRRRRRS